MNERQLDLIMSIIIDVIEDYLNRELAGEAADSIREGIEDSMNRFELLGGEPKKGNGKMEDGFLIELDSIVEIFRKGLGKCMKT